MPLNNDFYGVYKIIKVKTKKSGDTSSGSQHPYIIQQFDVKTNMETQAAFYMQGQPLTRVLNIGNISETYNVTSPLLVPPSGQIDQDYVQDGRILLNDILNLQYQGSNSYIPNNSLPLMTSAKIDVTNNESKITFTLESDGDPNNALNIYNFVPGTDSNVTNLGLDQGARVARNYDFYVDFGGIKYYVENVSLDLKLSTKKLNFLGAYLPEDTYTGVPYDGTHNGTWNPGTDLEKASYSGYQFPFIAVGGIEATATGKATVAIHYDSGTGTLTGTNYVVPSENQPAYSNRDALLAASNVTAQNTGTFNSTIESFNIYLRHVDNTSNISLIPAQFNFTKGIVSQKNYNFSADVMTFDFEVKAYYTTS